MINQFAGLVLWKEIASKSYKENFPDFSKEQRCDTLVENDSANESH